MPNPTTEVKIWMALRSRAALLTFLPIIWPGESAIPQAAHMEALNIIAPPVRLLLKAGRHDRRGTLQLTLKHPLSGLVYEVTQEAAGVAAEHFPCDLRLSYRGVGVRVITAPEVHEGFRDGGWWHTPVRIRWQSLS